MSWFKIASARYVIKRNDSIQIETNDKNNIKIISKIKWTSDCSYTLTYLDIENYENKSEVIGKEIDVNIIETNNNTYKCHIKSDTSDDVLEFTKNSP